MAGYPVILTDRLLMIATDPALLLRRLAEMTDPNALWPRKPFFGQISSDGFIVSKTPRGANFFLPEVVGAVPAHLP